MNPYTPQRPLMMNNMQDVSGQQPVFMNESAQEQLHRALLQQNLGSPVGQQRTLGVNPLALAQMLRESKTPYGGTPQGAYAQQGQYMQDAINPVTNQQQMLMNQGGSEFMSFNTPYSE